MLTSLVFSCTDLSNNRLYGSIPYFSASLQYLNYLDLSNNSLNGSIPDSLGSLLKLIYVDLSNNSLDGSIPDSFASLLNLTYLDVSNNRLYGSIPDSWASLPNLLHLDLSNNSLYGSIPYSWASLQNLLYLYLSNNSLNGFIPDSLGYLQNLRNLDLSNNSLNGSIPDSFGSLLNLIYLDLSKDRLYGSIPDSLASLRNLSYLFLNDNNLSGEVPTGLVKNLGTNFQYNGNPLLGVPSPAPSTNTATHKKSSNNIGIVAGTVVAGVLVLVIGVLWCFCFWSRKEKQSFYQKEITIPTPTPPSQLLNPPTELGHVSYETVKNATNNFDTEIGRGSYGSVGHVSYEIVKSATNNFDTEIGRGSYGSVYRGFFNNREVAIKVNNIQSHQGHREFITEVDILTRVHHKNLVSLIAYCNEGRELILIYEFEGNGTLQNWLHDDGNSRGTLGWKKRLEIAVDGAKGLEYLHKGCDPPIIHRDVKPSNILLDDEMTAKVADFGLSKYTPVESSSGYSTEVKGTIGYFDPEYFCLKKLTPKSDVYSYGVVLAEIITGLPPYFMEPGTMSPIHVVDWMRKLVERNDIQALADPNLQADFNPKSMWRMADTALACLYPVGSMRPDFTRVVDEINEAIALEKGFDVHSPAVRTVLGSFVSKPSTSNSYQNLSI